MNNLLLKFHRIFFYLFKLICVVVLLLPLSFTPSFVSANHVVCNDVAKPWNFKKNTCTVGRHTNSEHVKDTATDPMTYVWIGLAVIGVAALLSFSETEEDGVTVSIYDPFKGLSIFEKKFSKSETNFSVNLFKVENPRENLPIINQFSAEHDHHDGLFLESLDRVDILELKLNF